MSIRQASCVAVAGRAVLIEGRPGCGKSSLALALIDRGATFVADDGVSITVRKARLHASPVDRTRNLMEVRNLGLIEVERDAHGEWRAGLALYGPGDGMLRRATSLRGGAERGQSPKAVEPGRGRRRERDRGGRTGCGRP